MFADKKQNEFVALMEGVGAKYPHSQAILEFWASVHNELNRESQYFEVLIKLFDVYLTSGNVKKAAESLERLVDIDAYDFRNQERMELLRGKVEDAQLKRIASRLLKSSTPTPGHASHAPHAQAPPAPSPSSEEGRQLQALEDLIVQTEIFLQYSLHNKALERLQKIAAMFPGEEERNSRAGGCRRTGEATGNGRGVLRPWGEARTRRAGGAASRAHREGRAGRTGRAGRSGDGRIDFE